MFIATEQICQGFECHECGELYTQTTHRVKRCKKCQKLKESIERRNWRKKAEKLMEKKPEKLMEKKDVRCNECDSKTEKIGMFYLCVDNWDHAPQKW